MKVIYFILQILIGLVYLDSVKKISFLEQFIKDTTPEYKFLEDYEEFKENILEESEVKFDTVSVYKRSAYQCSMKKKEKMEKTVKLFTINNDFIINVKNLERFEFYDEIYSKIHDEGII